jgi:proprotein convertase subtilisin/kexin type 5
MTIFNNSICSFCASICKTCLSSNSSACTSCYSTYYLLSSECLSSCPNLYYGDSSVSQCIRCFSPCLNCQSATFCTFCLDSSLFLVNGSCLSCADPCLTCLGLRTNCTSCNTSSLFPYLNGGTCITTCPPTYYGSMIFTCVKCNSPCNSCQN